MAEKAGGWLGGKAAALYLQEVTEMDADQGNGEE